MDWQTDMMTTSCIRIYMELVAVVCIETSHYVSFVRCGDTQDLTDTGQVVILLLLIIITAELLPVDLSLHYQLQ